MMAVGSPPPSSNDSGAHCLPVGPDGPWTYLTVPVDYPDQVLAFYPSMLETPLIVNATACQPQTARCPLPTLTAWEGSAAHDLVNDENSAPWDPSNLTSLNGGYVTELMSLEGELHYVSQRFTYETSDGDKYLDGTATAVADNVTVAYPGGSWYTLGIGYVIMSSTHCSWTFADCCRYPCMAAVSLLTTCPTGLNGRSTSNCTMALCWAPIHR